MEQEKAVHSNYRFITALISGGVAGLVVDVVLFPIDTIKTRLQSERGFLRSGGFSGIYRGLAPVAAGSAPTAAIFFCTYETCKSYFSATTGQNNSPFVHMASASIAEVVACLIRVPVEIAKQRRQAMVAKGDMSALQILWNAYKTEGFCRGVYRGFGTTIAREIPFSLIQFPLWEYFKIEWANAKGDKLSPVQSALCGALAGGISAGLTTPLDVAKTRVMLSEQTTGSRLRISKVLRTIYADRGIKGIFAGFVPRVLWITIGGSLFFGFYDLTSRILTDNRQFLIT